MKCDKCGSELEGVWVGPGDAVVTNSGERVTVYGMHTDEAAVGVNYNNRGWTFGIRECRTLDGRPVLGYRDPRDERIKELEAELAEAREAPLIQPGVLRMLLNRDELRHLHWVQLDDEAIERLVAPLFDLKNISKVHVALHEHARQILRDFRDGRAVR